MSRVLKFRCWDKENKRWADHNQLLNKTEVSATVRPPSILQIDHPCWIFQQFTGILDCEGKEIYEGDVIKIPDGYRGIVKFYNGDYCLDFEIIGDWVGVSLTGLNNYENVKIVGNRFENPGEGIGFYEITLKSS